MNQRSILLICALLAAASSLATCQNRINFQYVDFSPMMEEADFPQRYQETLHLLSLIGNFDPRIDVRTALKLYRENIETVSQQEGLDEEESFRAHYLFALSNRRMSRNGFKTLVNYLMDICFVFSTNQFPNLNMFDDYLWINAQQIFGFYMPHSIAALYIPGNDDNKNALERLELAFGVHPTQNIQMTIQQKLQALINFDMKHFDRERAIRLGEAVTMEGEPLDRFFIAMYNHCKFLRSEREFHFNVIGLARAFGIVQTNIPYEVHILMEYNRLCASAATHETRQAIRGN